jgi:hypothetical protein
VVYASTPTCRRAALSATVLTLLVLPVLYSLFLGGGLRREAAVAQAA